MSAFPSSFSAHTRAWFEQTFTTPTEVQVRGWRETDRGGHVLIAAPTGSGKTLAAFLHAIDRLQTLAEKGELEDRTYVVYVSPLKALGNDIQKNLMQPLEGVQRAAREAGVTIPDLRVAVRTGDTPQKDRALQRKKPPHILITTPESLYILLTATSSREMLKEADTLILDEIHAVLGDKRGAHLALSIERFAALCASHAAESGAGRARGLQRIGLSATQKPMSTVAEFLVGRADSRAQIVDEGHRRKLDLSIWVPSFDLGPIATHEARDEMHAALLDTIATHRSTIIFCHTRRLVERTALALSQKLGAENVAAHHGSLSRETRLDAEQRLKSGAIKVICASASLELGIDVGHVDVVCHIGAPRSIASLLQRVGRSGHFRGAVPKGIVMPLTRDELVQSVAAVIAVKNGDLDALRIEVGPRDVLAQQIAAEVAARDEIEADALFEMVKNAYPFRAITRAAFDEILATLSDGITTRRGRRGALVFHDKVHAKVRSRRGARLTALTSGGAIPDTADYDVVMDSSGELVGKIHEDYAIESMQNDVFLLGNHPWRIRRVEAGRVRVVDASGQTPTLPFWLGEAPARTRELSEAVGALRERIVANGKPNARDTAEALGVDAGLSQHGAEQVVEYTLTSQAVLGTVPTPARLVVERFFDEAGGTQLIVHSPLGGRINRALGFLLRKRFCRTFDFELQAAATDDGVILSLGEQHSFPLETIGALIARDGIEDDLVQAILPAPMFENRWRWNAQRWLVLPRFLGGRKVPMPLQRMRAQDLLSAVFPGQTGCQDNHGGGPIEVPEHPLVRETIDNCLYEAMDTKGLEGLVAAIDRGEVHVSYVETSAPSPLSHEILNSNPYSFLDDAPLEERRARAVSLRRTDPDLAGGVGALDPAVIADVIVRAQPLLRSPDEAHDALFSRVTWPLENLGEARAHFESLVADGRAFITELPAGAAFVATERLFVVKAIFPDAAIEARVAHVAEGLALARPSREDALVLYVRGAIELAGPITPSALAAQLGLDSSDTEMTLARLELDGVVMQGRFSPNAAAATGVEWCDRRLLAQIHRGTIGRLRKAIEPVTPADFMRFLFVWQRVEQDRRPHGKEGVRAVLDQLAGVELPAPAWERDVLPLRVARYVGSDLDLLCLSGEAMWGRLAPALPESHDDATDSESSKRTRQLRPTRVTPLAIFPREEFASLLDPAARASAGDEPLSTLSDSAREAHAALAQRGAMFLTDVARETGLLAGQAEDALFELVAAGLVTGDGMAGLRMLLGDPDATPREPRKPRFLRALDGGRPSLTPSGRWSLLPRAHALPIDDRTRLESWTKRLLARYGVVFRELLSKERCAPPWRMIASVLRRMEARGEVRGGKFVAGFAGEQFAHLNAVDVMRGVRNRKDEGAQIVIAASDPLNFTGILTQGERVASNADRHIVYERGMPVFVGSAVEISAKTQTRPA